MRSVVGVAFLLMPHVRVVVVLVNPLFTFFGIVPLPGVCGIPLSLGIAMFFSLQLRSRLGLCLIFASNLRSALTQPRGPASIPLCCGSYGSVETTSSLPTFAFRWLKFIKLVSHGQHTLQILADRSRGVLRNTTGTWICGYQKCVGVVSILQAELWSVFVGLQVARSSGVARLIVQSDSSHAIKLLLDSSTNDHSMLLVRAIGILRQGSLHVDFQWIPREMNMVADCLSKLLPPPQFCLLVTSDIPEAAKSLLDRDREGPPYSRSSCGVT
ncbi:hypothetical protein V6N11_028121 [Hibiscus sabdariffa]|uniref:RNase H type-1 domain-containing protein n=1 Tax=Hibiscus sabdariffa TaxID=183260 RepID=A0ABR2NZT8_9ROSI